jgi:hypothetical protein
MKKVKLLPVTLAILLVASCEYFNDLDNDNGLSTEEIVEGLKTALEIGTDSATSVLAVTNGYYHGDEQFVKIPLPEEAEQVRQLITNNDLASVFNLDDKFEDVVKSVNWAAESAAKDAAPIFGSAIRGLSISEGWDILNGVVPNDTAQQKSTDFDSTAATKYLKIATYADLTDTYAPYINSALGEDLGLGFSAVQAWDALTSSYNSAMNNFIVQSAVTISGADFPAAIETDLGVFSTQKALDGLFFKVGQEERKIRRNPFQWAVDIIQRVFGYIQDQFEE